MGFTWRFLSGLTAFLDRLVVLAVAAAVLHDFAVEPGWIQRGLAFGAEHPRAAIGAAAALLVLNANLLQFVLFSLAHAPGKRYIPSVTPGGHSRVALRAIERALNTTANQVPEIATARVRVEREGRHRFRVHARYRILDVHNAGTVAENLRLILKKRFSELVILDPGDRVGFDLDLAGIVKVPMGRSAPRYLPRPRAPAEPFRGPVYPVEGELS